MIYIYLHIFILSINKYIIKYKPIICTEVNFYFSFSDNSHFPKVGRYSVYIETFYNLCLQEINDLPVREKLN